MAYLTQILRRVLENFGLNASGDLVLPGHKIYYNHQKYTDEGVVDLTNIGGGGGAGGYGSRLAYATPGGGGNLNPNIVGFQAGLGSAGTGRLVVTVAAAAGLQGLPAGSDGQQLLVTNDPGSAAALTLLHVHATTLAQLLLSQDQVLQPGDTATLLFDSTYGKWIIIP